jgi:predicted RNA binding protein YcfA (HicA-like mRNA interferase family)
MRAISLMSIDSVSKKVHEVISALEASGWALTRQRGSHRIYKHPAKAKGIAVSGKPSDTMRPGTLASIRRDSGLEELR